MKGFYLYSKPTHFVKFMYVLGATTSERVLQAINATFKLLSPFI